MVLSAIGLVVFAIRKAYLDIKRRGFGDATNDANNELAQGAVNGELGAAEATEDESGAAEAANDAEKHTDAPHRFIQCPKQNLVVN